MKGATKDRHEQRKSQGRYQPRTSCSIKGPRERGCKRRVVPHTKYPATALVHWSGEKHHLVESEHHQI